MGVRSNTEKLHKVFLSLYLFGVVFAPPVLPQFNILIALCSIMCLLLNYNKSTINNLQKSGGIELGIAVGIFLIYIIFMRFANDAIFGDAVNKSHYSSLYNRFIVYLFTMLPCCTYLNLSMRKMNYDKEDFIEILIWGGMIEATTCLLALMFPSIKDFFISIMNSDTGSKLNNTWFVTVRAYGFARTLVDVFGWGIGVMAGISFIYGAFRKRRYMLYSLYLLIATLLNARTGIVLYVVAIGMMLVYAMCKIDIGRLAKIIIMMMVAVILGKILYNYMMESFPATISWIQTGIEGFSTIFTGDSGKRNGFSRFLYESEWWQLPTFPRNLFGTGHSRYGAEGYTHTDFGYVNDIWTGGIIGTIFLYAAFLHVGYKAFKRSTKEWKIYILFAVITIFVFNIKACAVAYNPGMATVTLLLLFVNQYEKTAIEMFINCDGADKKIKHLLVRGGIRCQ